MITKDENLLDGVFILLLNGYLKNLFPLQHFRKKHTLIK